MSHQTRASLRTLIAILLVAITAVVTTTATAGVASAQPNVVGTADFRNAPVLTPGTYSDRIVTGDSAWYAVIYTNDTPYRFEVTVDSDGLADNVVASASFVAPTLDTIGDSGAIVSGTGLRYPSGHTNTWFLRVSLDRGGQPGIAYGVEIRVEGVETNGLEDCGEVEGCTFADSLAELDGELADLEARLDGLRSTEQAADVTNEINNLKGFAETANTLIPAAQARLEAAEAKMAVLCAPETMCETFPDPGSKTPLMGWAIGGLALIGGAARALKKVRDPEPEPGEKTEKAETSATKSFGALSRANEAAKQKKRDADPKKRRR